MFLKKCLSLIKCCGFYHFHLLHKNDLNLRLIHYCHRHADPLTLREHIRGKTSDEIINELSNSYKKDLLKYRVVAEDTTYSYDFMTDGKYISPTLRKAYNACLMDFDKLDNPFCAEGKVAMFAKRNSLFQKKNKSYEPDGFNTKNKYEFSFKVVYFMMRFLLKLLGPNKFMSLSRLLVFLSRYQANPELWRR